MDDSQNDLYWEKEDDKKSQYNMSPFKEISFHFRIVSWASVGGREYKVMNFCG